jgi:two-component system, LytTR family, response regulator
MKAIIIDDESASRDMLIQHLANHCTSVEVIGVAHNGTDGLAMIAALKPELVFLDVEMPDMTGFDLLQKLGKTPNFEVIFCTAHDGYAARAFRFSATDFLHKPIKISELQNAVIKAQDQRHRRTEADRAQQIDVLFETIKNMSAPQKSRQMPSKVAIQSASEISFIEVNKIIWLEADGNYSKVGIKNEKKVLLATKPLAYFEDMLCDGFFRSHRSFLINLKEIDKILKGDEQVVMSDQKHISVSKGRRDELLRQLGVEN